MKIKKHVNIKTLIERLKQFQGETNALVNHFNEASSILDNPKYGVNELNFNIDEDIHRFNNTYSKIEELMKGL